MGNRLGSPGAAGMGLDVDAIYRQVESVNPVSLLVVEETRFHHRYRESPKGTKNTSGKQKIFFAQSERIKVALPQAAWLRIFL